MSTQPMELATREERGLHRVTSEDFMPVFTVQQAVERKRQVNQFISGVMSEGEDFGKIPGAGDKKVLLKPGAEKLCSIFGLSVTYTEDKIVEDWTGEEHGGEPLFYYSYRCQLSRGGMFIGEAIGSCNSWESKYRYRWVPEDAARQRPDFDRLLSRGGVTSKFEPDFALEKKETTGQYGKPAEYWQMFEDARANKTARRVTGRKMGKREFDGWEIQIDQKQYRIPNPEVSDAVNTCQKMAQKRALVAAVLVVTNCSDAFTQDIEDFEQGDHFSGHPVPPTQQGEARYPAAFQELLDRAASSPKEIKPCVQVIHNWMIEKAGVDGDNKAAEIGDRFKAAHPTAASIKPADIRAMLVEMWDALQSFPAREGFDGGAA